MWHEVRGVVKVWRGADPPGLWDADFHLGHRGPALCSQSLQARGQVWEQGQQGWDGEAHRSRAITSLAGLTLD